MADIKIYGTLIRDDDTKIVRGSQVEGGYFVCSSLPTTGSWTTGQLCYCTADGGKTYRYNGKSWVEESYNFLPLSGGTMTGPIKFISNSLPAKNLKYLCGIDGFADGGEMGWQGANEVTVGNANKLTTPRTINGVNFDGSSDITVWNPRETCISFFATTNDWYRIAEVTHTHGFACNVTITQVYSYNNAVSTTLHINSGYTTEYVDIVQIGKSYYPHISKIRVVRNAGSAWYIDVYYAGSTNGNSIYIYFTDICGTNLTATDAVKPVANPVVGATVPSGYNSYEFAIDSTSSIKTFGTLTANGGINANGNLLVGTSDGAGTGLALWNTETPLHYGIHMSKTSNYGIHGGVTGDWATYFNMTNGTNRGWIFRHANTSNVSTGTNVASIGCDGTVTASKFVGALQGNADTATTASKLGTSTVGSTDTPIYLYNGVPYECSLPIKKGGGTYSIVNGTSNSATDSGSRGWSAAIGDHLTADSENFVIGHYNKAPSRSGGGGSGDAFVIGKGYSGSLNNAFRVTYSGAAYGTSAYNSSGADYAEYFEWKDFNPTNEDRRGLFVTLDENKIKTAEPGDYILGIISALPSVIGNSDEDWRGRYIYDEFGDYITEEFEYEEEVEEEVVDKETGETITITKTVTKTGTRWKENPDYDPSIPYIERKDRPEWDAVGMVGVLAVRDDGTCQVNGYCKVAAGGTATATSERTLDTYRVIERVNDHIVKVILK